MIPEDAILEWGSKVPWQDKVQIEQDLILEAMIHAIYSNATLRKKLAFRGGTCLNKLFWKTPYRYSEDLDFIQIDAEPIGPITLRLKEALRPLFGKGPKWEAKKGSFRLYYAFSPNRNPEKLQQIKIEINTREHFALDGYQKKKLSLDSIWQSGEATITTFTLEELLATKLRALYQRRKGRDLFDLWKSRELSPDYSKVAKMCVEYFHRSKKVLYQGHFFKNLGEKLKDPVFVNDLGPLLHPAAHYDLQTAADFVKEKIFLHVPESKSAKKKQRSQRSAF